MTSHDDRHGCEGIATAAWSKRGWPVMTGAVAAVGLTLTWRLYGPFGTPLALAGLWFFFAVVVVGTLSEEAHALRRAVRVGGVGAVVVLVLMGLLTRFPVGGWVAVGVCALTSPPVVRRVRLVVHRARRRLEEIVSDLPWQDT